MRLMRLEVGLMRLRMSYLYFIDAESVAAYTSNNDERISAYRLFSIEAAAPRLSSI